MKKEAKTKTSVTPLGDKVLIKPFDGAGTEKKSAAGIIIPSTVEEDKTDRGTVVAVGPGRVNEKGDTVAMKVKAGDKVLFQWGDKVKVDDEEYYIVSESSILAVIK